jgi:radical SAM protein with 4Fe4S-binding SPASM domain
MIKITGPDVEFEKRGMSLVLKPTEACNFSCSFCSSSSLVDDKKARLELEQVYQFLKRFPNTLSFFIVGGDPLMMPPVYYTELIKHVEENNYPTKLYITSNLWAFYKNPEKWKEVLSHPRVEVGTSFQYGGGRQIKPGEELTEEVFLDIYNTFKREIPHKELCFLAVVNDENEHLAIDHVYLAKKLGTQCRLVYANASGRSGKPYPLSKLYQIFIEIHKLGLSQYEQTAISINEALNGMEIPCPMSRNCDQWMRSLNPDGRYFSCGPLNDDLDPNSELDFESEVIKGEAFYLPQQSNPDWQMLKEECITCEMFNICNGCRKHVKDLKNSNLVEEHCTIMKGIMPAVKDLGTSNELKELRLEVRQEQGYVAKRS